MRIGSLFSGAGGLDIAVEAVLGGATVWHSEVDKAASQALNFRWPGVPNLGDITTVHWGDVPAVDVVVGGWPCQPFSTAGKGKGLDDERALWPHVARAIRVLQPGIVVLENVPGVLAVGEFDRVAADLAQSGYEFGWTCARASDIGAPHRRQRLFVVAISGDAQVGRHAGRACWQQARAQTDDADDGVMALSPTPRSSDRFGAGRHGDGGLDLRTTVSLLPTPKASDGEFGTPRTTGRPIEKSTALGTIASLEKTSHWGKYEPAIRLWERLTRPAPPPTEPNARGNPRLSAEFAQWMMGWPELWVTDESLGLSRTNQLKIIGNGVCPQQAATAITWLLDVVTGDVDE